MSLCDSCGQTLPETYIKGDLIIRTKPAEALWKGEVVRASPVQIKLLRLLVQLGEVSTNALLMALPGAESGGDAVQVHISYLRRALRWAGVPVFIIARRGWGYELIWREAA